MLFYKSTSVFDDNSITPPNPSFSAKSTASSKVTYLADLFFKTRSSLFPTKTIFVKL